MKASLLLAVGFTSALTGNVAVLNSRTNNLCSRSRTLYMGGATGYATTVEGKKKKVERVKELLDSSEMIFSVPAGSMTVSQTEKLREFLPEGSTVSVIKNTLMRRALEGTEYEPANVLAKGPNMWFFIQEDIAGTLEKYNAYAKEENLQESHPVLGGSMDGVVYDTAGVEAVSKLPSKVELIAKIAGSIKGVPTKLGRSIKSVPTKLARVIKAPGIKLGRVIKLAVIDERKD